jgi:hypothetical protein
MREYGGLFLGGLWNLENHPSNLNLLPTYSYPLVASRLPSSPVLITVADQWQFGGLATPT